uniref:Uncharacterized protein n=1 Tax=Zea mays TaxID=4577 RepID=B6T0T8_MAIZE|nr:hypothetical protein [Zea mays]ACG30742.1 hypothetical protein [Zea mays]
MHPLVITSSSPSVRCRRRRRRRRRRVPSCTSYVTCRSTYASRAAPQCPWVCFAGSLFSSCVAFNLAQVSKL